MVSRRQIYLDEKMNDLFQDLAFEIEKRAFENSLQVDQLILKYQYVYRF